MSDHRINLNGKSLDYTCINRKFATNTSLGYEHVPGHGYLGSVTQQALYDDGYSSLWLEHVTELNNPNNKCYWFMWYGTKGLPNIPASGVMNKEDLIKVIANIKDISF